MDNIERLIGIYGTERTNFLLSQAIELSKINVRLNAEYLRTTLNIGYAPSFIIYDWLKNDYLNEFCREI